MQKKYRISSFVSRLLLGLCCWGVLQTAQAADTSGIHFDLAGFNQVLDGLFCPNLLVPATSSSKAVVFRLQKEDADKKLSQACFFKTGDADEKTISGHPYYRLVRAQTILEAASRIGAARISDYSETAEQDATQLILSLQDSRARLLKARNLITHPADPAAARAALVRTDLAISLLKTASYALASIKSLFSGWYDPKTWLTNLAANHGAKIMTNLLEDRLYMSAYKENFADIVSLLENKQDPNDRTLDEQLWNQTDEEILKQCQRLARMANVEGDKFCAK